MCWRHKWIEMGRYFNKPSLPTDMEFKGTHQETLLKVVHGCTTVELRCEKCGALSAHTIVGDGRKP